jgi:hypothetical protein
MRTLLTNHGFTISVLAAIAIAVMFAALFEASQELAATLMALGALARWRIRLCSSSGGTSRGLRDVDSMCVGTPNDYEREICR